MCRTPLLQTKSMLLCVAAVGVLPSVGKYDCVRTAPFHPSIHNMGNVGYRGSVHASGAQMVTDLIDRVAYGGRNMRREVASAMGSVYPSTHTVLEVGCGVGTLTRHLSTHFAHVDAVDTSEEMLKVARRRPLKGVRYEEGNGADVGGRSADVAVCCMVFHELPKSAHVEVLDAMLQSVAREGGDEETGTTGDVWIVDIDPAYQPSSPMLSGEPYVPDYLREIETTLREVSESRSATLRRMSIVKGHVCVWILSAR